MGEDWLRMLESECPHPIDCLGPLQFEVRDNHWREVCLCHMCGGVIEPCQAGGIGGCTDPVLYVDLDWSPGSDVTITDIRASEGSQMGASVVVEQICRLLSSGRDVIVEVRPR
jgi:hypothetical protein